MTNSLRPSPPAPGGYAFGLIGYPLGHSFSPQIHATALHTLGLSGSYSLFPVEPLPAGDGQLQDLLVQIRAGQLQGLNVTIPHKQAIIPWLDQLTPAARAIGAVNTIYRGGETLIGDNTDAPGFWADLVLRLEIPVSLPASALILGAGGSARAVAYALLAHGWQITLAARRTSQAEELAASMQRACPDLQPVTCNFESIAIPEQCNLIVNTTPVGMHPQVDASPWPEGLAFPQSAALYDLVYNPRQTLLVQQARRAGLSAVSGLGMLVEQAALAFERWTGQIAPRAEMRSAVSGAVS